MAKDTFWFKNTTGPWRYHVMHPLARQVEGEDGVLVDPIDFNFWRKRVLRLCKYEITHQNFGLSYTDLMKLDPATFEEIEKAIYEVIEETNKQTKNLQLNPNGDKAINNILKGPTK